MPEYGLRVLARIPYSALELSSGRGREQVAHANKRKRKGNESITS